MRRGTRRGPDRPATRRWSRRRCGRSSSGKSMRACARSRRLLLRRRGGGNVPVRKLAEHAATNPALPRAHANGSARQAVDVLRLKLRFTRLRTLPRALIFPRRRGQARRTARHEGPQSGAEPDYAARGGHAQTRKDDARGRRGQRSRALAASLLQRDVVARPHGDIRDCATRHSVRPKTRTPLSTRARPTRRTRAAKNEGMAMRRTALTMRGAIDDVGERPRNLW